MDVPFKFSLTSTDKYGLLWNPNSVVIANSVPNAILAALSAEDKTRFGLNPPNRHATVIGMTISTDVADVEATLGCWDVTAGAFIALCPLYMLLGDPVVDGVMSESGGYFMPLSATLVPAIQLTTGAAAVFHGHLNVMFHMNNMMDTPTGLIPSLILQDESAGSLLAEDSAPLQIEG